MEITPAMGRKDIIRYKSHLYKFSNFQVKIWYYLVIHRCKFGILVLFGPGNPGTITRSPMYARSNYVQRWHWTNTENVRSVTVHLYCIYIFYYFLQISENVDGIKEFKFRRIVSSFPYRPFQKYDILNWARFLQLSAWIGAAINIILRNWKQKLLEAVS